MSTKNICPRADGEGEIGISGKAWNKGNFKTVNAGSAAITGEVTAGSVSATNAVKAGSAEITGEVTAGSATMTGAVNAASVTATGAISAGSLSATNAVKAGSATITGEVTAGSAAMTGAVSAASVTATGAISAGSLTVTGTSEVVTQSAGDNSTKIASTAYVETAAKAAAELASLLDNILPKTAAAHNSVYRGKDLTSYFTSGGMSKAIAAGTFDDIFPGDYITKSVTVNGTTYSDVKWIVGDLDYHLHRGDTETTTHHVVLFPEINLGTARMNASDTTAGGYQGSEMWTTTIPYYATGIVNAFGSDHVLVHRERLTKAIDTNAYSAAGGLGNGATVWADGEWVNVTCNLFNEAMMFGNAPFASSGRDTYECNKQIAAFRYGKNFTRNYWCWLRDVASSIYFAYANGDGEAECSDASGVGGVRPYFLLY